MQEEWRDVVGFDGLYKVSNLGRVRSIRKIRKLHFDKNGYLVVNLSNKGKIKLSKVHRLVAKSFIPLVDNKECIDHIDCNKSNNRVDNLRWCTVRENTNWAYDKTETETNSRGVRLTYNGKYQVRKSIKGHRYHVGTFSTLKEAEDKYINFNI